MYPPINVSNTEPAPPNTSAAPPTAPSSSTATTVPPPSRTSTPTTVTYLRRHVPLLRNNDWHNRVSPSLHQRCRTQEQGLRWLRGRNRCTRTVYGSAGCWGSVTTTTLWWMTTEIGLRMIALDVANPLAFSTLPGWIQRTTSWGGRWPTSGTDSMVIRKRCRRIPFGHWFTASASIMFATWQLRRRGGWLRFGYSIVIFGWSVTCFYGREMENEPLLSTTKTFLLPLRSEKSRKPAVRITLLRWPLLRRTLHQPLPPLSLP